MRRWSDEEVESIVGRLLRWGVTLSAAMVAVGGAVFLARHGAEQVSLSAFQGEPAELRSLGPMVRLALDGHGRGMIQIGLVMLIATPVTRVAFSVVAFALRRDWTYVAITFFVLAILVYGLTGGV